jgi:putative hydrolase of the HAD superfamily
MIKNIVFDIGNVLLRWDPLSVVKNIFPAESDPMLLTQQLFKSDLWFAINLGNITEQELIAKYHQLYGIDLTTLNNLMLAIKQSLLPIHGSIDLLNKLFQQGYPLYALTDNTHEIMAYLKQTYVFWQKFQGIVVSAEIGFLKPSPHIYHHLLDTFQLIPQETLFIDDLLINVEGAKAAGMQSFQFIDIEQCWKSLMQLNTTKQ